jgi:Holliday junction resolvasome RuvABC endonuclease subunit
MIYTTFLGIDPGLSGALAVLNAQGELLHVHDLPTLEKGGFARRRIDPSRLREILSCAGVPCWLASNSWPSLAAIESVGYRKGDGGASGASLAHSFGVCEGVLAGVGVRSVLRPPPAIWKKAMGLNGAGKDGALARARDLWPSAIFKRHDEAEAALLARFAWLQRDVNPPRG